jgi:DNA-binding protein YbaB
MFKDMGQLMKQAREMQSKLQNLQEELGKREVQGAAGAAW